MFCEKFVNNNLWFEHLGETTKTGRKSLNLQQTKARHLKQGDMLVTMKLFEKAKN